MLRDLISFLPPELLSTIFDLAYDDSQAPCAPINRALLPFQRRVLFRHVRISSHLGLEQFVASIESNTAFGGMVTSLRAEDVDGPGGATTNKRRLKALVSALVNLERLEIGWCCSTFIELVLSPRVARSSLPRLCSLDIDCDYTSKNSSNHEMYRSLEHFPLLTRLGILAYQVETPAKMTMISSRGKKFTRIREFAFAGDWVDTVELVTCINCFPNLCSFALCLSNHPPIDYSAVVACLPPSLTSLTLRTESRHYRSTPCDRSLSHLVNLEYLYLGAKTFKQDVVDTLSRLPKLKTLGFGLNAFLPPSRLEELAINPGRLTSLRKIILDQFEGEEGWKVDDDSDGVTLHPSHAFSGFHVGPGWILPVWSSAPEQEWLELVNKIRAQGIQVEGTILKAFGVESAFETETRKCMVACAFETGDFDDCRDMYGNDFVDELLK